jgi:4-hydroxy-4-methyl-2-oxoglutarate aldolase
MTLPEGWQIVSDVPRAPDELVARFRGLGTGPVCDALGRFAAMDYRIKPLGPDMQMAGSALTVWTRPCDHIVIYKALEMAQTGDVLVIVTNGHTANSTWGELTSLIGRERGLSGVVTDGVVRDSREIVEIGVPVFARGLTPNSPLKNGPGQVNVSVTCGGTIVRPGDILVGDADGVVVVPLEQAEVTLERVSAILAKEAAIRAEIEAGLPIPSQMAGLLRQMGL